MDRRDLLKTTLAAATPLVVTKKMMDELKPDPEYRVFTDILIGTHESRSIAIPEYPEVPVVLGCGSVVGRCVVRRDMQASDSVGWKISFIADFKLLSNIEGLAQLTPSMVIEVVDEDDEDNQNLSHVLLSDCPNEDDRIKSLGTQTTGRLLLEKMWHALVHGDGHARRS